MVQFFNEYELKKKLKQNRPPYEIFKFIFLSEQLKDISI